MRDPVMTEPINKPQEDKVKKILSDPEKRARLLYLATVVSTIVMVFGYIIILYVMFFKR